MYVGVCVRMENNNLKKIFCLVVQIYLNKRCNINSRLSRTTVIVSLGPMMGGRGHGVGGGGGW